MKAYSKSQLAQAAGVSMRTFSRWLKSDNEQLALFGIKPSNRILPPVAVAYLVKKYDIDLPDS